ncbi:MAG: helix-turn-helix domain-containing protein [Gammaproteobacteria bacterium]|nr:helix-turn-helix domain-containing protein [Gammaproteobacteria bacterium]NND38635.1 hypothetical protein [Pseudomonadales bacterium]NNM11713.1 hypothetical protein [Pseudomonadales bacterium]RZV53125.1 MAG: hypothetical protein EX270_09005 [Pseudomonadales bacterium]
MEDNNAEHIKKYLQHTEQNMKMVTNDPIALHGFTQVPNFLFKPMKDERGERIKLSIDAKFLYAKYLSYAWHNNLVFPGQETMAKDLDMSRTYITKYTKALSDVGLLKIVRRGQGKTNLIELHFRVSGKVHKQGQNRDRNSLMSQQ